MHQEVHQISVQFGGGTVGMSTGQSAVVVCRRCGKTFSRPSSLRRHRAERRCPGQSTKSRPGHVQSRPGRVRAEILDVTPSRSGVVRPGPESASARPVRERVETLSDAEIIARFGTVRSARSVQGETRIVKARPASNGDGPPSWWEPQAAEDWRGDQWAAFPADYRNRILAQRAGTAFTIRAPQAANATVLWSQFYALKAMATRLDAEIGTERERVAFEAGLREYNKNFDRIAQRKALPG